jgi:NAD+ synthase
MQAGKIIDHIVKWLKDYAIQNSGVKGFTVGISNGVDSSVVSTLCARTGLPVLALELPIDLSKKKEKSKSVHVEWLKKKYGTNHIRTMNVNLTDAYKALKETCTELQSNDKTELALANVQSRLRMVKKRIIFYKIEFLIVFF